MGFLSEIKEMFMKQFMNDASKTFGVTILSSGQMQQAQDDWNNIVKGQPRWKDEDIKTINFASTICQFASKKACQDIAVSIDGSARADFISKIIDGMVGSVLRDKVEDACALGGIILKPNGNSLASNAIDYVMPFDYAITEKTNNGDILGIVFYDRIRKGDLRYTRLEYHHFVGEDSGVEGRLYAIENRAFRSTSDGDVGKEIALDSVPEWQNLEPIVYIDNVEKMLFGYLKMPWNNKIDYKSPEGVSIFANCIEELRDLDIAWSKKGNEVEDSQHITFVDETSFTQRGKNGRETRIKLPRFVKGLRMGVDSNSTINEHVPTMLTADRVADINSILSMISTKCGFSQGTFTFDAKSGMKTATEIESDQSETVETISDIRESMQKAINDLIYALGKYCDVVYGITSGYVNALDDKVTNEDVFYFKDLLASFEQDRNRAYQLMNIGKYSTRKYLKEYEGFSDAEIDEMMEEIKQEQSSSSLFGEE